MRFPPPEVIAAWPRPDYKNPVNRGPTLMIVELTVLPLALLCLALRLYVRMHLVKRTWWDDWLMVAAAFFCCGVTIAVILATQLYGWNIHAWDLTYIQMVRGRQVSIAGQTIFVFASGLSKLSILASYLRIALPGSWFLRLTWATIVVVGAAIPAFLLLLWLQCSPASSYWNLLVLARDCIPEAPPLMGQTTVTVITDFIVYVLPMPTLWKLQLPLAQRISLMILFGFGGVVVIAGCMRTYWVHYVELETYDVTWEGFYLWIWAAVEVNLGVICGCAPVLKPLLFPAKSRNGTSYHAKSSTINTFGTSDREWSRKRKGIRSTIARDHEDGYIDLESLESGKDVSYSAPTTHTSVQVRIVVGKRESSDESIGYPRGQLSTPSPAYMGNPGRYSDYFKEQSKVAERRSKSESWIDDKSDEGSAT